MISSELSTIIAKDVERSQIAEAMDRFLANGGSIQSHEIIKRGEQDRGDWRTNHGLALAGSSAQSQADQALVSRIRELAEKGAGITSMKMSLQVDTRRIKRLADANGIEIKAKPIARALGEKARLACIDAGKARRAAIADKIRPMIASGMSTREIESNIEASRRTVLRVIKEFGLRGEGHVDA